MIDGLLDVKIINREYEMKSGDMLFINSRDIHSYYQKNTCWNKLFMIQLEPSFYSGPNRFGRPVRLGRFDDSQWRKISYLTFTMEITSANELGSESGKTT